VKRLPKCSWLHGTGSPIVLAQGTTFRVYAASLLIPVHDIVFSLLAKSTRIIQSFLPENTEMKGHKNLVKDNSPSELDIKLIGLIHQHLLFLSCQPLLILILLNEVFSQAFKIKSCSGAIR
jgi:hypothetical protein